LSGSDPGAPVTKSSTTDAAEDFAERMERALMRARQPKQTHLLRASVDFLRMNAIRACHENVPAKRHCLARL